MSSGVKPAPDDLLEVFHKTLLAEVRSEHADLSMRQTVILLTVYLTDEPQTVRGLAAHLRISKPAVVRGLDRLQADGLVRRMREFGNLRSVIVVRTAAGAEMVERLKAALEAAGSGAG
jgi:DNA-binding MarR family transcriptional regulator